MVSALHVPILRIIALIAVICCTYPSLAESGDPMGERNLASSSSLPQGPGLAAKLGEGQRIDQHPDVIFAEDFESDDYRSRWNDVSDRWTKQKTNTVYFDDVVIAREYIGPK